MNEDNEVTMYHHPDPIRQKFQNTVQSTDKIFIFKIEYPRSRRDNNFELKFKNNNAPH